MHTRALFALALGALTLPTFVLAQDTSQKASEQEPAHFKLVYRLLQIGEDGKVANARSYSTVVAANGPPSAIRNEDKIPIITGESSSKNVEYQYQVVGTHIDTREVELFNRQLSLRVAANSSGVVTAPAEKSLPAPVIRNITWDSTVVVTLDKPTIIFTTDNVSDTGKTELELTATEIKQP